MTLVAPPVEAQADLQLLRTEFPFFARKCLKIRTKGGELIPLRFNRLQQHLHEHIEDQRKRTGKVRKIVVKGRQGGASTYVEARYYWKLWRTTKSLQAFILTHEQPATDNIFGMARRYHDNLPDFIRPKEKAANAKELIFADTLCGYQVATAGTKGTGRSSTMQLFHGSEVAYWPNAEEHIGGVFQTLANLPDTEIILESTANGVGNLFHRLSMAAVRGVGEYELIFIPWFWIEEYECPCPASHPFSDDWLAYGQLHKLHWEQLYWAFVKNQEIAQTLGETDEKPCWLFKQEYPATFEEAFQTSGASFIQGILVSKARNPPEKIIGRGPRILGVDPSRDRDRCGIIDRCGRRAGELICEAWPPQGDTVFLAQRIAGVIKKLLPDAVNIDIGGVGAGVYDSLCDMGYSRICNPVNFGSAPIGLGPTGDRMYANRRAEMWDEMRDWFEQPQGVQIPDRDDLHADVTAPVWGPGATRERNNALVIEEKEKIKERLGASPDLGDALALSFAVPFAGTMQSNNVPRTKRRTGRGGY